MWKFKVSKYKNAAPKIPKNKEDWITNISANALPQSCGNHIEASGSLMAFQIDSSIGGSLAVLPLNSHGRKDHDNLPTLHAHADYITNFDFSPFDDFMLSTCSQDCMIKIWKIPEKYILTDCNPLAVLKDNLHRVDIVKWHPTAEGILTAASQTSVKVYDVQSEKSKYCQDVHKDLVQGLSWKADGTLLATSSKDKKLRILDPRTESVAQEVEGHTTAKDSRIVWMGDKDYILTTGFGQMREREVKVKDVRNFSSTLSTLPMGTATGVVMPFYDPDTNMIFLAGRADTGIKFVEFTEKAPYLAESGYDVVDQIKGLAMIPKLAVDVMEGEVNRLLLLTMNSVIPVPYIVPRKSYTEYHSELFPDTANNVAALSADQWFSGQNAKLAKVSLEPSKRSKPVQSAGVQAVADPEAAKTKPSELETKPQEEESKEKEVKVPVSKPEAVNKSETPVTTSAEPAEAKQSVQKGTSTAVTEKPVSVKKKAIFSGVRQSKFRHWQGKALHKSTHITNIRNLSRNIPGESDMFHANPERCAVPLAGSGGLIAVFEMSNPSRLPDTGVPALQNGCAVMDFVWDPFDNSRLCVACDDAKIRVWQIPAGGLQETLTDCQGIIPAHSEKIYFIRFHPLAKDVLVSASYDMSVRLWDLSSLEEKICLQGHTDTIFCLSWSLDGRKCATVCKDRKIRIYDPRKSVTPVIEGAGPEGSRGARSVWACDDQYLVISGFDKASGRTVFVYDSTDLTAPLHTVEIDTSPSILTLHYDEDSSSIFLTGRGDATVFAFEVSKDPPHLFPLSAYKADSLHQAVSFLPKLMVNVKDVEFARMYRLTANSIEPVSCTVPRVKKTFFQDDIFPDTKVTWEMTLSSEEWFAGTDRVPKYVSLKPSDMTNLSEAPANAPKPQKFESYQREVYKTDEEKKEELLSAMTNKLELDDGPLPQDLTEGVEEDEWDD